jgi:predicted HNH restriction endonuclease
VRYLTSLLDREITMAQLRADKVVQSASFLKSGPAVTVFPVTVEQGERIVQHVYLWNRGTRTTWRDLRLSNETAASIRQNERVTERSSPEGRKRLALHQRAERDPRLAENKKRASLQRTGALGCEVCGFEFGIMYGELGRDFIEVHHRIPLSLKRRPSVTKLEDLATVCSNCHRMLHRGDPPPDITELRRIVKRSNHWELLQLILEQSAS